jgi:hypothetical protein
MCLHTHPIMLRGDGEARAACDLGLEDLVGLPLPLGAQTGDEFGEASAFHPAGTRSYIVIGKGKGGNLMSCTSQPKAEGRFHRSLGVHAASHPL